MDEIQARLIKCFQAVFTELTVEQVVKATPDGVASWDSVESFTLLAVIEEEFGLRLDMQNPQEFASFLGILSYLRKEERDGRFSLNELNGPTH